MVCVIGFIIYKKTEFSFDELGLKIKNSKETFGIAFAISATVVALLAAAMILLGALGGLYEKQRNIWGVAIIHYVLGQAACCLGFLA